MPGRSVENNDDHMVQMPDKMTSHEVDIAVQVLDMTVKNYTG